LYIWIAMKNEHVNHDFADKQTELSILL
jgi:hypothetical protein